MVQFYGLNSGSKLSLMSGSKLTLAAVTLCGAIALAVPSHASELVTNGDFTAGNIGFTTDYGYATGATSLYPEGLYSVDTSPQNVHPFFASFGDHTTGTGNMMIVNGHPDANKTVWSETIGGLHIGSNYALSAYATSVVGYNPANLEFSINGIQVGSNQSLSAGTPDWSPFAGIWHANSNSATIRIVDTNTVRSGNDFALDDISFKKSVRSADVPEPGSLAMLGAGSVGFAGYLVRRKRR